MFINKSNKGSQYKKESRYSVTRFINKKIIIPIEGLRDELLMTYMEKKTGIPVRGPRINDTIIPYMIRKKCNDGIVNFFNISDDIKNIIQKENINKLTPDNLSIIEPDIKNIASKIITTYAQAYRADIENYLLYNKPSFYFPGELALYSSLKKVKNFNEIIESRAETIHSDMEDISVIIANEIKNNKVMNNSEVQNIHTPLTTMCHKICEGYIKRWNEKTAAMAKNEECSKTGSYNNTQYSNNKHENYRNENKYVFSHRADNNVTQPPQQKLNIDTDVVKQSAQTYLSPGYGGYEPPDIRCKNYVYNNINNILKIEKSLEGGLSSKDFEKAMLDINKSSIDAWAKRESDIHLQTRYLIGHLISYRFSTTHSKYKHRFVLTEITENNSKDLINEVYSILNKIVDNIIDYRLEQYAKNKNPDTTEDKIKAEAKILKDDFTKLANALFDTCIKEHNDEYKELMELDYYPENKDLLRKMVKLENDINNGWLPSEDEHSDPSKNKLFQINEILEKMKERRDNRDKKKNIDNDDSYCCER